MRHRIIDFHIGLGNPSPALMNNILPESKTQQATLKKCFKEGISLFFKRIGGCDFGINNGQMYYAASSKLLCSDCCPKLLKKSKEDE